MKELPRDLTEGSIIRSIWRLALPIMIGNVLQNTFTIVDMIFVGSLGPSAIAAVGMSGVVLMILFTIIIGVSTGTVAMIARFIGAKEHLEAENVAMQSVLLGLFFYVIVVIIGYPLAPLILKALGAGEDVITQGIGYIRIMFIGSLTMILGYILGSVLRASGDAVTPLKVMIVSTILNIELDPIFIFGWGEFSGLGVEGSALATVIARCIGVLILIRVFLRGHSIIHLKIKNARVDFPVMLRILKIGIFASIQAILRNISGVVLIRLVAFYQTFAVAAYVINMRLQMIVMMPGFGLATAVATLVGQNLGAGKPKRAERTAWITVSFGATIMASSGIVYIASARHIVAIFNTDPEVIRIGVICLRTIAVSYGFIGLAVILGRGLNGAGDTVSPMIMTAVGLLVLRMYLTLLLAAELGIIGIWFGIASSSIIQGVMTAFWFNTGRWKLKQI